MDNQDINIAFLSRQPILDRKQELAGYELFFRDGVDTQHTADHSRTSAAALVCAAYAEIGIRSALGATRAFICVDSDFLHDDAIELLPPDRVVLALPLDIVPDKITLERCRVLRGHRYSLALADYAGLDNHSRPLLAMVDIININIHSCDGGTLKHMAGSLQHLPLKLLAQGVNTSEQMEHCRNIGFQLFQGQYFAQPEIISGRRLSATQSGLIRLINLTGRDAKPAIIEEAFKREPALMLNLLRIANTLGNGQTQQISSLRDAITQLGRRQLQRWLQLLLLTPDGGIVDTKLSSLLQLASLRGRMMEVLTEKVHPGNQKLADLAFITGITSMMPTVLGLPIDEILTQIATEPEVQQALSMQTGKLGTIMALLECFDNDDMNACDALLLQMGTDRLDRLSLNTCLTEALRWVHGGGE
jgi:c-di-GMP-related signal transduction protein